MQTRAPPAAVQLGELAERFTTEGVPPATAIDADCVFCETYDGARRVVELLLVAAGILTVTTTCPAAVVGLEICTTLAAGRGISEPLEPPPHPDNTPNAIMPTAVKRGNAALGVSCSGPAPRYLGIRKAVESIAVQRKGLYRNGFAFRAAQDAMSTDGLDEVGRDRVRVADDDDDHDEGHGCGFYHYGAARTLDGRA